MQQRRTQLDPPTEAPREEGGVVLFALVATLFPIVGLALAAAVSMQGRNEQLLRSIHDHRSQLAAESGLERLVYRARTGQLVLGDRLQGQLSDGMLYDATPINWRTDGVDNDGDGSIDEADEDRIEIAAVGSYRFSTWRVNATFRLTTTPAVTPSGGSPQAALYLDSASTVLQGDDDDFLISGFDRNIDGSLPAAPKDVIGLAVPTEQFHKTLSSETKKGIVGLKHESQKAQGHSMGPAKTPLDLAKLVSHAKAKATKTFKSGTDLSTALGDASKGQFVLAYCEGDVNLKKGFKGAGVLVVNGKLQGQEWGGWTGLVLVMGDLQMQDCDVTGALMVGKSSPSAQIQKSKIQFSSEAIGKVGSLLPDNWLPGSTAPSSSSSTSAPGTVTFAWGGWSGSGFGDEELTGATRLYTSLGSGSTIQSTDTGSTITGSTSTSTSTTTSTTTTSTTTTSTTTGTGTSGTDTSGTSGSNSGSSNSGTGSTSSSKKKK